MCEQHQHETATTQPPPPEEAVAEADCCGGHPAAPAPIGSPGAEAADLAECPVMPGSLVDKADAEAAGLFRDHGGRRYWLCCAACAPMWDADPDRYAAA